VNFVTNFAQDVEALNKLALDSFGIRFLNPGDELETLMNETRSNFQEFYNSEKLEILAMFEELPEGFHKQEGLKYLVRRIDGQDHPIPSYKEAAAIAWTGMETIEFMSKAFVGGNLMILPRMIGLFLAIGLKILHRLLGGQQVELQNLSLHTHMQKTQMRTWLSQ
jgi:hypothetical protein